jgi:hypothetical protein
MEYPDNHNQRLNTLFRRLYSTSPRPAEQNLISDFLERQEELFKADQNADWQKKIKEHPKAPKKRALASLAQVLMASNRFLYID